MFDGSLAAPVGLRYPTHLIDVAYLPDGSRVTVRPTLPQDAALQQAFVRNLSADARYHRFLTPIRELTPDMLDRLTQVDHRTHLALAATAFLQGEEIIVGEARYALDAAGDAEFAIAVADAWQGLGLGRLLLRTLECAAAAAGVRRMVGETLRVNASMLGLARGVGYALKASAGAAWMTRLEKLVDRGLPCNQGVARVAPLAA